jgi:hypothetical protein
MVRVPWLCLCLLLSAGLYPSSWTRAQDAVCTIDYFGNIPPSYPWTVEVNPGVSYLLAKDGWNDYYLSGTVSWQPEAWLRLDGSGEVHSVNDPAFVGYTEVRPMLLAAAIWPTQGRSLNLFNPEFNVRLDYRSIHYEKDLADDVRSRIRFQITGRFTVNDSILSIGTFYVPWALESYTDLDGDPKERQAYMWRWRAGIGYVVSGFLRAELHYIAARSRDTTTEPFFISSRTVWLAVRHYY